MKKVLFCNIFLLVFQITGCGNSTDKYRVGQKTTHDIFAEEVSKISEQHPYQYAYLKWEYTVYGETKAFEESYYWDVNKWKAIPNSSQSQIAFFTENRISKFLYTETRDTTYYLNPLSVIYTSLEIKDTGGTCIWNEFGLPVYSEYNTAINETTTLFEKTYVDYK